MRAQRADAALPHRSEPEYITLPHRSEPEYIILPLL